MFNNIAFIKSQHFPPTLNTFLLFNSNILRMNWTHKVPAPTLPKRPKAALETHPINLVKNASFRQNYQLCKDTIQALATFEAYETFRAFRAFRVFRAVLCPELFSQRGFYLQFSNLLFSASFVAKNICRALQRITWGRSVVSPFKLALRVCVQNN